MSRPKRRKKSVGPSALAKLDQDRAELRSWLESEVGAIAIAGVMQLALKPPDQMRAMIADAPDSVLAVLGKLACMAIVQGNLDLETRDEP